MKLPQNLKTKDDLFCDTFGHNYTLSKKVSSNINQFTCKVCNLNAVIDKNGDLIENKHRLSRMDSIFNALFKRLKQKRTYFTN